ncbi:MAG: hypothetical protein RJQ14_09570 [Marinoscillum sp.]
MIGSEDFQFPVIINSQKFKPNQERNGIQHNESSDLNNQIINKAVELCESFLKESIERYIGNVHYLLKTPNKFDFGDNHWINREWYKNLISSLREKILSVKMIRTFKDPLTKVSILDESNNPTVYFLSNELVKKLGSKLDEFVSEFSKIYPTLPLETEIRDWQSILWEDKSIVQIDLKAVVEKISSFKNLKAFANSVKSEKAPEPDDALEKLALSLINSLCEYITLCDPDNKDSYLSHKKDNIEYGFLPSRSGDFKLFNELLMDVGCFSDRIGEELLDIHQNFYPDRDDYRNSLIHHEIMARTDLAAKKEEESVIQEILKEVEDNLKSHTLIVKAMEEGKIIEKPKRDLIESNLGDFWEWATEFDIKEEHVKDSVRRRILQTIIDPRKSKFLTANLALDRSGKLSLERQSEILSDEELNEKLIQGQIMLDAIKNENEKFETLKKIGKYFESLMKDILHESFGPEQVQHVDGNQDFIIEDIHIELKSTKINQILMHPEQAETAQIKKTQYYLAVFGYDKDYQEVTKEEFKNGVRFTNDIGEKLDGIVVNMGSCESGDENVQVLFPDVYKSFDGMKKYKYVVKKAAWGSMNFDEFVNEVMK